MSLFVKPSDFAQGDLKLAYNNLSEATLQAVCDSVETETLWELFGVEMAEAFIADFDVDTQECLQLKYEVLRAPFAVQCGSEVLMSEGIKRMLMYFVFFEYGRMQATQMREIGATSAAAENSTPVSGIGAGLHLKYNKGVSRYTAIQQYISYNPQNYDYTSYKGTPRTRTTWL